MPLTLAPGICSMPLLRIFVADSHEMTRCVVTEILASQRGWEVCGEATDGQEAVDAAARLRPDIILLDVGMPNLDGWAATRRIIQNNSNQKVIILGEGNDEKLVHEAFDAGAVGFVPVAKVTENLVGAIQAIQDGRSYFTPRIAESLLQSFLKGSRTQAGQGPLTEREREVVRLLSREVALTLVQRSEKRHALGRFLKYLAILVIAAGTLYVVWDNYGSTIEDRFPIVDTWLVRLGLKPPPPPPVAVGNPEAKVWVDVHTALYYCPKTSLYGRTQGGKYAKQSDAQRDGYQPANRKGCD